MTNLRARWLAAACAVLMVAGACSGTPNDETAATTDAPTTAAPVTAVPETTEPTPTTASAGDESAATTTDTQATVETTSPPTTEAEAAEADEEQSAAEDGDASTESTETDTSEPASGDESETDESTEGDEGQPDDTPEADEAAQPYWKYRSVGTAFHDSAFYDHNEIKALFPHCPPQPGRSFGWIDDVFAYWDKTYAHWDTDSQPVKGSDGRSYRIATGWWTDEQLEMFRPGEGITAASARQHAGYWADANYLTLWRAGDAPQNDSIAELYVTHWPMLFADGRYAFENLYRRLESNGFRNVQGTDPANALELSAAIRDDGVQGNGPNPAGISVGHMLAEWMITRYQYPPTTREPAAWAMRTLLTEREALCVADAMTAVCNGQGEEPLSPVLDRDHRFGRVLWSLVCPEA